ncbi:MAG: 2-isopropylmalate synthase [Candidatus Methylarchaceae archaeon HK01B]|nr:2-isopropylmalate synthase [Candidatus Methylarchaceae archaeon HK01M]MCP8312021.1 2-isopropylmalate synthase [Candidatus Methylarchaceae archaeon HK02M1]MCP8319212.1 2-isopropylmalate synthase [Candidatus Methylarchaceae archaeon HK01B]
MESESKSSNLESRITKIDSSYLASWYNKVSSNPVGDVFLLDSTLREGEQSPGVSFTVHQSLQIAWMLDYFGVNAIEISPIVSPSHKESCRRIVKAGLGADIIVHVRALPKDIDVALDCDARWIAMYHSVSDIHLKYKLRVSREETIRRAVGAVEYAKSHGLRLRFTMEDASRSDPEFLNRICKEVAEAGADRIGLPDTLGILRPQGMYNLVRAVREVVDTPLDVHCHNDLGLATANSLAGIEAGADQIHVTINGLGERVGIAPLAEVVMALKLIYRKKMKVKQDLLSELSNLIERYTGVRTPESKPIVGENAYKHKAGTHVAAIIREPAAYELIPPKAVGNKRRVVFGELSGKNSAAFLLHILGLSPSVEEAGKLAQGLKKLQCGDLFELSLSEELEEEVLKVEDKL